MAAIATEGYADLLIEGRTDKATAIESTAMTFVGGTKRLKCYVCGPRDAAPSQAGVFLTGARGEKR